LFITITCNPKWLEIQDELQKYEKDEKRPDLIARVFYSKIKELSDQIINKHIFGQVAAKIQFVEFQKGGLSHEHILIILDKQYKIKNQRNLTGM